MNNKKTLKEIEQKLKVKKENLEKQLASFANKDEKLKGDWDTRFPEIAGGQLEEAASEVEEYSTNLPIEHSLESRLKEVNSALERIKGKKYGICEKCGKKIPEERLKISPESKLCIKCEKK